MTTSNITSDSRFFVPGNWTATSNRTQIPDAAFMAFATILTVNWIFGTYFNFVCIFVFLTNPGLRSQTNKFIFALNICDLLICSIDCPACAISAWFKRWLWGYTFCVIDGFLFNFLVVTSVYILTYISFHRYMVICRPAWVPACLPKQDYAVCGVCFVAGCLWALVPIFEGNHYRQELSGITCGPNWKTESRPNLFSMYLAISLCLAIPFAVMIFSYCSIVIKISKSTGASEWENDSETARRTMRREKSVMQTCILIIVTFFCCWIPTFVIFLIQVVTMNKRLPCVLQALPPVIGKLQSLLDPIVYAATNKQICTVTYKWCYGEKNSLPR